MSSFVKLAWLIVIAMLFCGSDIFFFILGGLAIGVIGALIGPEKIEKYFK